MNKLLTRALAGALFLCAQTAFAQNSGTTLNLKDADINALIATVSDVTGKNFIIDPRVKGKVTVLSSAPMGPDELYGVFLAVLQVHGFAAVPAGPVVKIVPEVGAKQDGGTYFERTQSLPDDEVVTRVLEIQNVPAAQLVPILRPLVPQYGHLAAYSPSNMLIISDRAANVSRLSEIIRRIDQTGDRDLEVIPLEYASATDVQRTVSGLLQSEQQKGGKDPSSQPLTVLADERTNSILMAGDKSDRIQMRAVIAHLDIPLEQDDGNTQVIYLNYANAETLGPILEGYVQSSQTEGNRRQQQTQGNPNITSDVRIVAEPDTNALVITAPPKVMRGIKNVIAQLDIRRAQVLVEAILAEVSVSRARTLGIDWAVLNRERIAAASIMNDSLSGALSGAASLSSTANLNASAAVGLLQTGLNVAGGRIDEEGTSFVALLNLLHGDADTNVLSTPSLVTMDNEEAEISVGQEVPFLTGSFSSSGATTGIVNPFQTIERRDVGLTLGITPQINAGDTIQLTIKQEVSNVVNDAGQGGAVDLVTNKRTLNTTVMVEDGDILVLGGLIDENVSESKNKIPILGDIPLLGSLFRSTSAQKRKQNLMIFIRSVILRDRNSSNFHTHRKYDHMREQQQNFNTRGLLPFGQTKGPKLLKLEEFLTSAPPRPEPTAEAPPAAEAPKAAPAAARETPASASIIPASAPAQPAASPGMRDANPLGSTQPILDGDRRTEEEATQRKKMGRGHLR